MRLRHTGTPVNGPFLSCGFCVQAERSPAPDAIIRAQKVFVRPRQGLQRPVGLCPPSEFAPDSRTHCSRCSDGSR